MNSTNHNHQKKNLTLIFLTSFFHFLPLIISAVYDRSLRISREVVRGASYCDAAKTFKHSLLNLRY
jgi:hypothetical protein